MKNTLLFCALCALWGCKQANTPENEGIALSYATSEQSKTDILTEGDAIGVFAAIEGTENNFLENAKYIVGTDGRSLSTSPAVYYPDAQQAVAFTAYLPFGGTWSGAVGTFAVPTDQSTATALKQADLCWATASSTPVATPVALEFQHKLARLLITTNTPTTKIAIPNAFSGGTLDMRTGVFTNTLKSEVFTTGTELIVPAQPLTRLLLTVAGVEHPFTPALPLDLPAGQTTTLNLTLNPITKTATLSGSSTTNWVASATQGNPTQAVSNAFTIHWPKCHPQSASVDRIVLTTKDITSGTTTEHTISSDITYADQTFAAPFASSTLRYPYVLLDVALYQASTWIHSSGSILGAAIVKSGACVVGVRQPLNPPAESDYIKIGSLYWAKGNLVAENNNECRVGAPTDYGVYFQFGSLIGWTGGANGNGVGQGAPTLDKALWPTEMGSTKPSFEWQNNNDDNISTLDNYYFDYSIAPWNANNPSGDIGAFAISITGQTSEQGTLRSGRYACLGVGDPCTYYLGTPWCTPTGMEYAALTGSDMSKTNRGNPLRINGSDLMFLGAAYRSARNGNFDLYGSSGYYNSASFSSATNRYDLGFHSYGAGSPLNPNSSRATAFSTRCVQNDK